MYGLRNNRIPVDIWNAFAHWSLGDTVRDSLPDEYDVTCGVPGDTPMKYPPKPIIRRPVCWQELLVFQAAESFSPHCLLVRCLFSESLFVRESAVYREFTAFIHQFVILCSLSHPSFLIFHIRYVVSESAVWNNLFFSSHQIYRRM